jgi:hypothetical protein
VVYRILVIGQNKKNVFVGTLFRMNYGVYKLHVPKCVKMSNRLLEDLLSPV